MPGWNSFFKRQQLIPRRQLWQRCRVPAAGAPDFAGFFSNAAAFRSPFRRVKILYARLNRTAAAGI
jgi:hypothetical protein